MEKNLPKAEKYKYTRINSLNRREDGSTANQALCFKWPGGSINICLHVTLFSYDNSAQRGFVQHAVITPPNSHVGRGITVYHEWWVV
jgi:hypothetical protein